ncbi:Mrx1p KNAG_0L01720 [Huiozyma naganishii CBS 8797]|uniref:Mitochondrial group I intron splicing factor CCM1 n=1 Tax=Huiozyma naganishii (strain ATCC MYA-139 / BCRC 22969 / CBS 8797 / KCTC 17520 / NBRC 10181 / NCYC 3082 / Yp74L-3) TaxID=1071383 RepID=J7S3S3_HUIN7|nr:hypothetical protein KNAG_0L01720 [Kazachstania naganishii CBS 8797]CCK72792.1 hypothetical protein KNAG_0L01720 [Kazachstania naganishii CBS 8797]
MSESVRIRQFAYTVRFLSTSRLLLGSQLKLKLDKLNRYNLIINKTPKELKRVEEKKRIKLKKLQKKAYPKYKAEQVLRNLRETEFSEQDTGKIEFGPTTNKDLKYLSQTSDKRLLYAILGITGEQLRDSKLVYNDVKKFLQRDQIEKALFLTKLAKGKGLAAMNLIMEHYLKKMHSPNSALELYNWRKKSKVPVNEYTHTILFDGIAKQPDLVSAKVGFKVSKIAERLMETGCLNQIEFNAALGALSNCEDPSFALKLFNSAQGNPEAKHLRNSAITFMWLARCCNQIKDDTLFADVVKNIVLSVPRRCCDERLMIEICKIYLSRTQNKNIQLEGLVGFHKYFDIPAEVTAPNLPTETTLPGLSHWGLSTKFSTTSQVLDIYLNACFDLGLLKRGIKLANYFIQKKPAIVDMNIFHTYLRFIISEHPTNCINECLEVYQKMDTMGKRFSSKHTLVLLYEAFKKQSNKHSVNKDSVKVDTVITQLIEFIESKEAIMISDKDTKIKVYPRKTWKFVFHIFNNLNTCGKVGIEKEELLLKKFIESLKSGQFDIANIPKAEYPTEKYIELETVRLIGDIMDKLELSDIKLKLDEKLKASERKAFLRRRHLLQLKSALLKHISIFEVANTESTKIPAIELDMKHAADIAIQD